MTSLNRLDDDQIKIELGHTKTGLDAIVFCSIILLRPIEEFLDSYFIHSLEI